MPFSYREIILRTFSSLTSFRQAAIRHRCRRKQPHQLNKEKRSIIDHGYETRSFVHTCL
jgi:hypothetical protein